MKHLSISSGTVRYNENKIIIIVVITITNLLWRWSTEGRWLTM